MEKKKETKKRVVKKTKTLNETIDITKDNVKKEIINNPNKIECIHCHKYFDKGLSICPYCRKSQKDHTGITVMIILAIVMLLCIIGSYFIKKYSTSPMSETEFKNSCQLVSYESLVRNPKTYKKQNIKVMGTVVSVKGTDTNYGNIMEITINANLFDETKTQDIVINYTDNNYNQGFIEGDLITAYGEYTLINGNTPTIEAKYIIFGK